MSRRQITHEGVLKLIGNELPCYVLEDGTRVISGRGMQAALKLVEPRQDPTRNPGSELSKFLNQKGVKEVIFKGKDLEQFKPITCYNGKQKINGYEATVLADICDAILEARKSGAPLSDRQLLIAEQCEMLIRSFAKVGIIALIDEVTGYQQIRDKEELQKFLEKFIRKEYAAWVKRFPPQLLEDISRLKGWEYKKGSNKYYPAMGHVINDLVYSRLAPGILDELKRVNPVQDNGRRKVKHHMWLTDEIGIPSLAEHLIGLRVLASTHNVWRKFYEQVNRAYPIQNNKAQLLLNFPEED